MCQFANIDPPHPNNHEECWSAEAMALADEVCSRDVSEGAYWLAGTGLPGWLHEAVSAPDAGLCGTDEPWPTFAEVNGRTCWPAISAAHPDLQVHTAPDGPAWWGIAAAWWQLDRAGAEPHLGGYLRVLPDGGIELEPSAIWAGRPERVTPTEAADVDQLLMLAGSTRDSLHHEMVPEVWVVNWE